MAMPYLGGRVPQEIIDALSIRRSVDLRDALLALLDSLPKFTPAELEVIRQATTPRMVWADQAPYVPLMVERAIMSGAVPTDGVDGERLIERLRSLCTAETWVLMRYLHPIKARREASPPLRPHIFAQASG
jgi:hypothetical protein